MARASAKPEFRLRFAEIADTSELVSLINVAFIPEQVAIDGDRIDAERLQGYLKTGKVLLLDQEQGLAGCVYAEVRGGRGYIGLLAVRPELRGRGLGRKLMSSAEEYLADAGCQAVDLRTISARHDLVPMYKHLGYRETGTAVMPPEIPLKIPCHFIVMSKRIQKYEL